MAAHLSEERAPYRFHIINFGGLYEGLEFVGLATGLALCAEMLEVRGAHGNVDAIISEDEGCVRSSKFGV